MFTSLKKLYTNNMARLSKYYSAEYLISVKEELANNTFNMKNELFKSKSNHCEIVLISDGAL